LLLYTLFTLNKLNQLQVVETSSRKFVDNYRLGEKGVLQHLNWLGCKPYPR